MNATATLPVPAISTEDRAIIRGLAAQLRELADSPANAERRRLWYKHDQCQGERPLILVEDQGGSLIHAELPLSCHGAWARGQERWLRGVLKRAEIMPDDEVYEARATWNWTLKGSGFGVEIQHRRTADQGGAFHIEPPIKDLPGDLDRLQKQTWEIADRAGSLAEAARLHEAYDGILEVQRRGNPWWTFGMTIVAIDLIGLERLMLAMYDEPEALHRLMAFLRDDHLALLDWMEAGDHLAPNNGPDYIGSGSRGYTTDLPSRDRGLRSTDIWGLVESQETVGVGAKQFAEFIYPYQEAIARRFGKVYYGCCEPVNQRWKVLERLPNLRRVSVSPWCDEAFMAEALGRRYVFSRKPNPTMVSTDGFDEAAIRADLRTTIGHTRRHGCSTEIILKDVHTVAGDLSRLGRWARIAREEAGA